MIDEQAESFIVRDATGQRSAAKLLTTDEARRIAANFAKLRELVRRGGQVASATPIGGGAASFRLTASSSGRRSRGRRLSSPMPSP
jgi:hypothetical protein